MADQDELYGTDVRITDAGDIAVTPSGDIGLISGPLNCVQALSMRLRTEPGELPLHPDYGNPIGDLVGAKADEALMTGRANAILREALQADRRFLSADSIAAVAGERGGRVSVSCRLRLAGGERIALSDLADVRLDEIDTVQLGAAGFESDDDLAFLDGQDLDEIPELEEGVDDPAFDPDLDEDLR